MFIVSTGKRKLDKRRRCTFLEMK